MWEKISDICLFWKIIIITIITKSAFFYYAKLKIEFLTILAVNVNHIVTVDMPQAIFSNNYMRSFKYRKFVEYI